MDIECHLRSFNTFFFLDESGAITVVWPKRYRIFPLINSIDATTSSFSLVIEAFLTSVRRSPEEAIVLNLIDRRNGSIDGKSIGYWEKACSLFKKTVLAFCFDFWVDEGVVVSATAWLERWICLIGLSTSNWLYVSFKSSPLSWERSWDSRDRGEPLVSSICLRALKSHSNNLEC